MDRVAGLLVCLLTTLAATAPTTPAKPAPPPRHASLPAVSPDGNQVVFCSDRDGGRTELYVCDLATGLSRRLTYSDVEEQVPAWTAGGTRIAYTVSRGDTTLLESVAPDGGGTHILLRRVAKAIKLSNDGRRVAYTVGSWTRNRIWVANADGSHARAVTDSTAGYFNLAWSPDDHLIAATHRDSSGALQIWLVSADGAAKPRELVKLPESEGRPQWPAWSPDGTRIAFQSGTYVRDDPARSDASICVVDVASGTVRRLRAHPKPFLDETPAWLDRDRIVFQSTQTGAFELWVMQADGSGARRVTK